MANQDLIDIVDDCINRLANGETISDCLQDYPQYADQLLPMLSAGNIIRRAQVSADKIALSQGRVAFRFEQALRPPVPRRASYPLTRVAGLVAMIFVFVSVLFGGITLAAQNSLPGDSLYRVKRLSEQVQLSLSSDKDLLAEQFNQRRLDETRQVIELGRLVNVDFKGTIERLNEAGISLAGFNVTVPDSIRSINLNAGMQIQVFAQIQSDRQLIADAILILELPEITPFVDVTTTPTVSVSATPSPTLTTTNTPTQIIHPSANLTPSPARSIETNTPAACAAQVPDGWFIYTIQSDDTPSEIALASGIELDELLRVNCNITRNSMLAGQNIFVPRLPIRTRPSATSESRPQSDNTPVQAQFPQTPTRQATVPPTQATRKDSNANEQDGDNNNRQNNSNKGRG